MRWKQCPTECTSGLGEALREGRALTWRRHLVARAQTMWKEWRQDLMWHPSVAPLRLQALHLIMRPRRTASSTFSRPPDSLTHTCAIRQLISQQHQGVRATRMHTLSCCKLQWQDEEFSAECCLTPFVPSEEVR